MSCAQQPIPAGWKIWRQPVPAELAQIAVAIRDRVRRFPLGSIAQTIVYNGQSVGFFVSSHTWTYRRQSDGSLKLVTGICIPGVSLLYRPDANQLDAFDSAEDLSTPDPDIVMFTADDEPSVLAHVGVGAAVGLLLAGVPGAIVGGLVGYIHTKI